MYDLVTYNNSYSGHACTQGLYSMTFNKIQIVFVLLGANSPCKDKLKSGRVFQLRQAEKIWYNSEVYYSYEACQGGKKLNNGKEHN